jgi:glycyl-tRNA synthetase beta chain
MPDFLLEIGTEEIPARMIDAASAELRERVAKLLERERLPAASAPISVDTPRRLAVIAPGIPGSQADLTEQVTGPALSVAYKDGQPTQAAQQFAKKHGLDVTQLGKTTTPRGEYLAATVTRKGRRAADILGEALPKEILGIYWPKSMYWRKPGERFVRPVRWLVAMIDGQVVPLEVAGIRAGNTSRGHRVLGAAADGEAFRIEKPGAYADALRNAMVLGGAEREHKIRKALDAATRTIPGARWREDEELLKTVVNLTEFPSAILGSFDPAFLALPGEVLVTVMRDHQKYFAIEDANGKLLPHFLAVLNTDGDPDGLIQHGNERVLRARFNDARFFWETDQKHSLLDRVEMLKSVTFQKDLGSYYEKTMRLQRLASWISETIKQSGQEIRPGVVHKAVLLAKADLTTELVKEFTELQGIVGGLYLRAQRLDQDLPENTRFAIADAIYDQYKPESMEDEVPRTMEGAVLSLADKADSVAGMFALGLQPTGSKDPFALRRQANGIVRILAAHKLNLPLELVTRFSLEAYCGTEAEKKFAPTARKNGTEPRRVQGSLNEFFRERLEFYLKEAHGLAYDVVNATLAAGASDVVDVLARAEAVAEVRPSADFESISSAFKRMKNILRQASEAGKQPAATLNVLALQELAEKDLASQIPAVAAGVQALRAQKKYTEALQAISKLRPHIDTFFDKVMVMVEDEQLRANRLALLHTLLREFSTIADFSEIVTEVKA